MHTAVNGPGIASAAAVVDHGHLSCKHGLARVVPYASATEAHISMLGEGEVAVAGRTLRVEQLLRLVNAHGGCYASMCCCLLG